MILKYKDQVSVNFDNVVYIVKDTLMTSTPQGEKCAIRFHSVDGFEKHWECDSLEEASALEDKILKSIGQVIEL